MRFTEIGQQLRAYRLESGLRAEEIAARLGVSRAALYRYEKGEVIKLDTVKRLAELLKISPLSLLGIGVEYYNRPIGYFERLRQLEENVDANPAGFLARLLPHLIRGDGQGHPRIAHRADRGCRRSARHARGLGAGAWRAWRHASACTAMRRPSVIAIVPAVAIQRFLETGVGDGLAQSERVARLCRQAAVAEVEHMATLMETEPMGLQFGLLPMRRAERRVQDPARRGPGDACDQSVPAGWRIPPRRTGWR